MTVLVLGTGFLGSEVVRTLLASGRDVVTLTRTGTPVDGARAVAGDIRVPGLALDAGVAAELERSVTHIVSCFGSVDWGLGPADAMATHVGGTRNVLDLARRAERLERLVHVSSLLALGRARGRLTSRELSVGQPFRNWYEFGKHHAEAAVREADDVPSTSVRLGPLLGGDEANRPSASHGLVAALPWVLRGYPVPLWHGGAFPCWAAPVDAAAAVVAAALDGAGPPVWTWFDPAQPSLGSVLGRLAAAWDVVPRIVDLRRFPQAAGRVVHRLGAPRELLDYCRPWFDVDPAVLDDLPFEPVVNPGYVERTGELLRGRLSEAWPAVS